ncbi:Putative SanA protein [gamma proteobacterium HdN1]|nr:Putative SanA protein [gamma proteobacterium HdN1]
MSRAARHFKKAQLASIFRIARWGSFVAGFVSIVLFLCDFSVSASTQSAIKTQIGEVPEHSVVVVLGTSWRLPSGKVNPYYKARVDAVDQLYRAGKVQAVVVSGDNATPQYNEPRKLRKDLIARGIPAGMITMDFAGFRTLDSVVRAREVFRLDHFVVVSQRFQIERALYIAKAHQIDAIGFVAKDPQTFGWRVRSREVFARFLAVLDVTILNTAPRFLGPKVDVPTKMDLPVSVPANVSTPEGAPTN